MKLLSWSIYACVEVGSWMSALCRTNHEPLPGGRDTAFVVRDSGLRFSKQQKPMMIVEHDSIRLLCLFVFELPRRGLEVRSPLATSRLPPGVVNSPDEPGLERAKAPTSQLPYQVNNSSDTCQLHCSAGTQVNGQGRWAVAALLASRQT